MSIRRIVSSYFQTVLHGYRSLPTGLYINFTKKCSLKFIMVFPTQNDMKICISTFKYGAYWWPWEIFQGVKCPGPGVP